MTTFITVAICYGLVLLFCWAICSDSKRRDGEQRWDLTDRGNEVAAGLAGKRSVEVYDAREQVYIRATRHPSVGVMLEYRDPEKRAEELAADLLSGGAA